jgi:hypothetical protein
MNHLLLAIDDGWTNANYNWADLFFIVATALALLAAIGYLTPVRTTADTNPPSHVHRGLGHWAAGLLALAVACAAFAWFLL